MQERKTNSKIKELEKKQRKERKEQFRKNHPILSDIILKIEVAAGVIAFTAVPFALGYSMRKSKEESDAIFNETNYELDKARARMDEGPKDYIDDERKFHQDIGYGCFAVWPNVESYLEAEAKRLQELSK